VRETVGDSEILLKVREEERKGSSDKGRKGILWIPFLGIWSRSICPF